MKKRERNLLILLILVVVVAIPFLDLGALWPGGGSKEDLIYSPEEIAAVNENLQSLPEIEIDLLNREVVEFKGARKNLFTYGEAYEESSAAAEEESGAYEMYEDDTNPEAENAEDTETRVRQQKLAGYELLGMHEINGVRTATFGWRGRTFVGRTGQTINDAFEIRNITARAVQIFVLNGQFEQTLHMKSPAGNTGGKEK